LPEGALWETAPFKREATVGIWGETEGVNTRLTSYFEPLCVT